MRPTYVLVAVALLGAGCISFDLPPIAFGLFDGTSLAGWEGDARFWRVEDGAIVGEASTENPCVESSWLVCTAVGNEIFELADFELEFDFRCEAGNSGLEFRARRMPDGQVMGLQADLDADDRYTGGLYEQAGLGRGLIAPAGSRVRANAAGELATVGAAAKPRPARGEWRRYRIEARGPRVRLFVDGELTSECIDAGEAFPRAGVLALQLHAGHSARVEVRDLRLSMLAGGVGDLAAEPQWIWGPGEASADQRAWFAREFELDGAPYSARLEVACDNAFEVRVNGERAFAGDDWSRPVVADVAEWLHTGSNRIEVAARNAGGAAGLLLALDWELGRHGAGRLVSDASWSVFEEAPQPGGAGAPAVELARMGEGDWGTLGAPSEPARTAALPGEELTVAEGYTAELVYSVPRELQGSWVVIGFDAHGRALTSAERGGLYRLTLPADTGGDVVVELLDDELGGAQGLLALGRDLYLVCSPRGELAGGVWRLRDADGDDRYELRELLFELTGAGEHGPHALIAQGERILLVAGNHTPLPPVARTRVPPTWAEDQLLPAREDANGHAWGIPAPGGWVVSMDRDGRDLELVAAGMRNAYDIALGPEGELFAYDSDMEWDVGLPWYRYPRLLHLVSGADFGWRRGSGKWPADWPDTLPSVVDTDLSSPVGMLYGAELTAFTGRDRAALFLGDWAYGRVLAVDLEPRGASWGGTVRSFLSGMPLPVTDLASGPDGCLYVTTGGRNTQSGLYRVRPVELRGEVVPAVNVPGADERMLRRRLESAHLAPEAADVAAAWSALRSDDPFLRNASRVVIEGLAEETWIERLGAENDPRAVAQAVVALAHRGDAEYAEGAVGALESLTLETLDDAVLVDALRALALVEVRLGGVPEAARERIVARLEAIAPRGGARIDRELVLTLVALGSQRAVELGLPLLENAATQEDAIYYANVLVEARTGWDADSRERFLGVVDALPGLYTGGNSFRGFLLAIANDAHARLGDGTSVPFVAAAAAAPSRPFLHDWQVAELLDAEAELASGRDFERGRALFREATCFTCHRMRGEGGGTGPDLTGAGSRFTLRDLLEAVLEPSVVVSDLYAETEVLTSDDELIVGRSVSDRGGLVRILKLPPDERVVEIPRDEVLELRPHPFSRMPEGLVDGLEREELLDLLAFLRAGGDVRASAFRPAASR
ncbi:MAG TPA: family 16 glycoside hydrolase [Planctomycetota bacterium]|nr:family 16 glycoside hydrolase [Planctomycetota bacterium]